MYNSQSTCSNLFLLLDRDICLIGDMLGDSSTKNGARSLRRIKMTSRIAYDDSVDRSIHLVSEDATTISQEREWRQQMGMK